jgi:hypothetical protein
MHKPQKEKYLVSEFGSCDLFDLVLLPTALLRRQEEESISVIKPKSPQFLNYL